jgi:hypothetical protein
LIVLLLSLILGAGTAVLISCGGDDGADVGIPQDAADGMIFELNVARSALEEGDCAKVEESANEIQANAAALADAGVDAEVREGIDQGAARLAELANDPSQCEQTTTEETTTEETEPTTTTEETEPTTTTETTTTEEETTTTETEEEPAPPEDGGEDGGAPPGSENGDTGTGGTGDGDRAAKQGKHDKKPKKPKHKKD